MIWGSLPWSTTLNPDMFGSPSGLLGLHFFSQSMDLKLPGEKNKQHHNNKQNVTRIYSVNQSKCNSVWVNTAQGSCSFQMRTDRTFFFQGRFPPLPSVYTAGKSSLYENLSRMYTNQLPPVFNLPYFWTHNSRLTHGNLAQWSFSAYVSPYQDKLYSAKLCVSGFSELHRAGKKPWWLSGTN